MSSPVEHFHLIICAHGLVGTPEDLQYFSNALVKAGHPGSFVIKTSAPTSSDAAPSPQDVEIGELPSPPKDRPIVIVLNSAANVDGTFDGVDFCAFRLVQEIKSHVKSLRLQSNVKGHYRHLAQISLLGHSLGGLIARFAVGLLEQDGFFASVPEDQIPADVTDEPTRSILATPPQPSIFVSFATPHVGMPPESRSGRPWLAKITAGTMGRTGLQLYLLDDGWDSSFEPSGPSDSDRPRVGILEAMTKPGSNFMVGLSRFDRVVAYANATYDFPVAFRTASLYPVDPFVIRGIKWEVCPQYDGIVTQYTLPTKPLSFLDKVKQRFKPPALFNPRRIPAKFPLNYLIVLLMPLFFVFLLPPMLAAVIFFFRSHAKKSAARLQDLIREERLQEQGGERDTEAVTTLIPPVPGDDSAASAQLDSASTVSEANETWYARRRAHFVQPAFADPFNNKSSGADPFLSTSTIDVSSISSSSNPEKLASTILSLLSTSTTHTKYPLPPSLPPTQRHLHTPQLRMIAHWSLVLGHKFERHFVKIEDVFDTHPLIVVKREANKFDLRGRGIVQHFIDKHL
ncbi:unnamed protein product [Tilletia controversa]|uniref:DUF676 domain-containing protein n=1 Tax=Tilletia controversa TaxID=13291 RepID=A0A8X7SUX8_9BASI|nr:hypothetical protein A4X06_0g6079 [Tilletia controversa]CAD6931086.1 unnamed protein product [Tilletia controversa]CAD6936510.1 unnamed protein product [Tilletia controversa]CAD6983263.1 unnamed protein product [Tilletia controversa]CAD6985645.1 unnamed protein product [Tilletia controversa]